MPTKGPFIPPVSSSSVLADDCRDVLYSIQQAIRAYSTQKTTNEALKRLMVLRDHLAVCLQSAEIAIADLHERCNSSDLIPDSDPVLHVRGAVATRMPDVDSVLACDPDDRVGD